MTYNPRRGACGRRSRAGIRLWILVLCVGFGSASAAPAQSLPAGWSLTNVGSPSVPGTARLDAGVYTVEGAGTDIWNSADQFAFVHRALTGDATLVVRVDSIERTDSWTKAGLMIRESLAAGSKHGFVLASAAKGLAFQRRTSTNGSSAHTSGGSGGAPVWLKLERRGSTLTASRAPDGAAWTRIGSVTIAMNATVYAGLAVTSHEPAALATARFSGLRVETGGLPDGWAAADVGAPQVPGSAEYANSAFTVRGSGVDIWDQADQFTFAYRQVSGDVDVVARVAALDGPHAWSKAGVMVRASLQASAAHAFALASSAKGIAFQRRPAPGYATLHTSGGGGAAPVWVKLERRGSAVTAFRSGDGVSWAMIGSESMTLGSAFYVGLAVTSHDPSAAARATFTNVSIQPVSGTPPTPPSVALTSPADGATFQAPATIDIAATASDADSGVALVEFYAGTALLGTDASSPYTFRWSSAPAGSHAIRAVARDGAGAVATSAPRTVTVTSTPALPTGWSAADVGPPSLPGSVTHSEPVFTVRGAGLDIWGTADEFTFAYRQAAGDVDVVARVSSLNGPHRWAKAGVMVRASLAPGAAHASLFSSLSMGLAFQRRPSAGATSVHTAGGSASAPVWLKVTRRGSAITAYASGNGSSWTMIGSQTIALPSTAYVGLAVTSHDAASPATAAFTNVTVGAPSGPTPTPPIVSLTSPAGGATFTAPATIGLAASASDADNGVAQVEFYAGTTLIGVDRSSPYTFTWSGVPAGSYSLTAVATDNAGATARSAARSIIVNDPLPPTTARFNPSPDHNTTVTSYRLEIFTAGVDPEAAVPMALQDLGKPAVVNGECSASIAGTISGLPSGDYFATLVAVGPGGTSGRTSSSVFRR